MYDSTAETLKHRHQVQKFFYMILKEALDRTANHDESKLAPEEKAAFDEATPKLRSLKYPSPEYDASLKALEPALKHHYANNRHHPEHFVNGVKDMNLIDLIEMFCDWQAAVLRHENGDIYKSIEHNSKKFELSEDITLVLRNTADFFASKSKESRTQQGKPRQAPENQKSS